MRNLSLISGLAFFALTLTAHADNGCGPKQVCTFKGVLKAGQGCPASFCQDSAYFSGAAAASAGQVIRIKKEPATEKNPATVPAARSAALEAKGAADANGSWIDPPAGSKPAASNPWQNPPGRKAKADLSALPTFAILAGNAERCRKQERSYTEQSAECRQALDLDALGFEAETGEVEKFCRNISGGDEAAFARCAERPSLDQVNVNAVLKRVQRANLGNVELLCQQQNGDDAEAVRLCVGESRVAASRRAGVKAAPLGSRPATEGGGTSMSIGAD